MSTKPMERGGARCQLEIKDTLHQFIGLYEVHFRLAEKGKCERDLI